jgi:phosphopantothenoylcysteine synthetase/decarboxylase
MTFAFYQKIENLKFLNKKEKKKIFFSPKFLMKKTKFLFFLIKLIECETKICLCQQNISLIRKKKNSFLNQKKIFNVFKINFEIIYDRPTNRHLKDFVLHDEVVFFFQYFVKFTETYRRFVYFQQKIDIENFYGYNKKFQIGKKVFQEKINQVEKKFLNIYQTKNLREKKKKLFAFEIQNINNIIEKDIAKLNKNLDFNIVNQLHQIEQVFDETKVNSEISDKIKNKLKNKRKKVSSSNLLKWFLLIVFLCLIIMKILI